MLQTRGAGVMVIRVALGLMIGCGLTACGRPIEPAPEVIDSVFTRLPQRGASKKLRREEQTQRESQPKATDTSKIGVPVPDGRG